MLEGLRLNCNISWEHHDLIAHSCWQFLWCVGTAEDFKMFFRHGSSRATNTGAMENVRMIIEDAMQESFAMFNNDFKTITQRQAFLQVLHPKDRLRLLTMVILPPGYTLIKLKIKRLLVCGTRSKISLCLQKKVKPTENHIWANILLSV